IAKIVGRSRAIDSSCTTWTSSSMPPGEAMSDTVPAGSAVESPAVSGCGGSVGATTAASRRRTSSCSVFFVAAFHRRQQLFGIEPDPVLEHDLDVLDIGDPGRWVALDHDEVGALADRDASDPIVATEVLRTVERGDLDRLDRREPGLDEQLDLALVA